jgi:adenylosuccinate synthase
MRATVVIGAGFGDEGKGRMVDHVTTANSTVVRYCSGANAGHTVVRDGKRHVFHHFGSGSLKGAATYLSKFFIHNPILYLQELQCLNDIGVYPEVAVDRDGLVTVPSDMMLNQMVEMQRSTSRHGSCGVGINETIKRSEAGYSLLVSDLQRPDLLDQLQAIRTEWVPARLAQLGIEPSEEWQQRLDSSGILDAYLDRCAAYCRHVSMQPLPTHSDLVFEGAQGLLLDEDHEWFPYVTHAHTGLHNVVTLLGNQELEVIYVTRAYATRHGPGPFPREVAGLRYIDTTNVPNDWQGTLRFGHLDLDLLIKSVRHDLTHAIGPVRLSAALTCLDQIAPDTTIWYEGHRWQVTPERLTAMVGHALTADRLFTSTGPQAEAMQIAPAFAFT